MTALYIALAVSVLLIGAGALGLFMSLVLAM